MDRTIRGCFLALFGGICWGLSGSVGQYLFTVQHMDSRWLVPIRLGLAGLVLFVYCLIRHRPKLFSIWKEPADRRDLILYGLCGISFCQFFYFLTIQLAGAAMGTILQDLSPIIILLVICVWQKRAPRPFEIVSLILALLGVLLLVSHGDPSALRASVPALITGVLSAVGVAFYNLAPKNLVKRFPLPVMLAWSFLMGGLTFALIFQPWHFNYVPSVLGFLGIAFVVLIGNITAFSLYTIGVKEAGPVRAVLFGFSEPVTAAILTVTVFHGTFTYFDLIGFACIFIMLILTAKE